jgi:hypothetical protein
MKRIALFLSLLSFVVALRAADQVVISEFMARNGSGIVDEDGSREDWIEIFNAGTNTVNLFNWSLTDNAGNLTKWRFPATNIGPGRFIIVWASDKNRRIPGAPLHTNFKLSDTGEYLALVRADGSIATQFSPTFPLQAPNVSYGIGFNVTSTTLFGAGAPAKWLVPTDNSNGSNWVQTAFDDSTWSNAVLGIGFNAPPPTTALPQIGPLANSVAEFSGVQGQSNWFYGYYNKAGDTDGVYNPDTDFSTTDTNWTFTSGSWQLGAAGNPTANPPWTTVGASSWHPNGSNSGGEQWAIRRWISPVAAQLHIVGTLTHTGTSGDGTRLHVIVDGTEVGLVPVFRNTNEFAVNATVRAGSKVDFALDAGASAQDGADGTSVSFEIHQGVIADSQIDWTSNGLPSSRGWNYGTWYTNAAAVYNITIMTNFSRQPGNTTPSAANHWDGTNFTFPLFDSPLTFMQSRTFMNTFKTNSGPSSTTNRVYFPVRRYIASASDAGLVRIFGTVSSTNRAGNPADGIVFSVWVDGSRVINRTINNNNEGYALVRRLSAGSVVDFVFDARTGSTNDPTYFTATLQKVPDTLQIAADSFYDWLTTSTQGFSGWRYGYYNRTADVDSTYDPEADFTSTNDPNWTFTGSIWQLGTNGNPTSNPPWTEVQQLRMHPNGTNQVAHNMAEHWAIRRWVSDVSGNVSINWHAAKISFGGNGVTALLLQNGIVRDSIVLTGTDQIGSNRIVNLSVAVADKIDFAVTPYGPTLGDDGSDGTSLNATIFIQGGLATHSPVADSRNDWSTTGTQGHRGWTYGYYDKTADGSPGYQTSDFTAFPRLANAAFGSGNFWTGSAWDWFAGNPPWDFIGLIGSHPNGTNNAAEHWVIRRWTATVPGDLRVNWWLAKDTAAIGGNGVSGHVIHNGVVRDSVTIGGSDLQGSYRSVIIPGVQVGDIIDFAHTPVGTDNAAADGTDGSFFQASIYQTNALIIATTTDIGAAMFGSNATAFIRVPFNVSNPGDLGSLMMKVKYNDGFVAWLNGVEVARRNAPTASAGVRVANSTNDWAGTGVQGVNGWYYGYYNKTAAGGSPYNAEFDFNSTDLNWGWTGSAWALGPGDPPWTQISQTSWHPNGSNSTTEQWAIRRWVVPVGGRFNARVYHGKGNTSGNGTTLRVFLNGKPLAVQTIAGNNTAGVTLTIPFTASPGDTLDFALDALGTDQSAADGSDTSNFGCLIDQLPSTDVTWNSTALANGGTGGLFEDIDIDAFRGFLIAGQNVLAIQGLNATANDPDFYIEPQLVSTIVAVDTNSIGYFTSPTAGNVNGISTTNLGPVVDSVAYLPKAPFSNDVIHITAEVLPTLEAVSGVTLYYRVMFAAESNTPMFDDGAHGDGAASDGVWGADIPANIGLAGQMIRWRVVATDLSGDTGRLPVFDDPIKSPQYFGTMYQATNISSKLPILHWFVENPGAANNVSGTRGAFYFKGQFIDNATFNRHGQSSGGFVKRSYNFDMPRGESIRWNDDAPSIDDFSLITTWADKAYMRDMLAYEAYTHDGAPGHFAFAVRVQQNNAFFSVAHFVEKGDDNFLQRIAYDEDGALYKMYNTANTAAGNEKKTRLRESNADLQDFINSVTQTTNAAVRTAYMWDNMNVPVILNFLATKVVISDHDCCHKNYYFYRDSNRSGEWYALPWDVDLSFGHVWNSVNNYFDDSIITNTALFIGNNNVIFAQMFNNPQMRQMYLRRVRTLMDTMIGTNSGPDVASFFRERIDAHMAELQTDATADLIKWGTWNHNAGGTVIAQTDGSVLITNAARLTNTWAVGRQAFLYGSQSVTGGGEIPLGQSPDAFVGLWKYEVSPNSNNQEQEWLAFTNYSSVAIDISGWEIDGAVRFRFVPGTVIAANSVLYVSPNVAQFRARTVSPKGGENNFVTGPYAGHLSARGEPLTLTDDRGRLVSSNYVSGTPTMAQLYLRVTELNYNPAPGGAFAQQDYEFIELKNVSGTESIDLVGVAFTNGVSFKFTSLSAVTNLAPGQRVVLVKNSAAFISRYGGGATIAGVYSGSLDNAGERVTIWDARNEEVLDFTYNNSWYPETDGLGFSLEIVDELAAASRWNDKDQWRPSGSTGGSPGAASTEQPQFAVVVSEVLAHTDLPELDYIELQNLSSTNVDISGWFITDNYFAPGKFVVPNGTVLGPGEFVVFYETNFNTGPTAFSFSSTGEDAYLFSGNGLFLTGYSHGTEFEASANGVAFSRYINSVGDEFFVSAPRTESVTNAYPYVGPVVISEINYHPPDRLDLFFGADDDLNEFIEIHNTAGTNVALFDESFPTNTWRVRGDADFDFPTNIVLAPDERILVVGFDPLDAAALAMFQMTYGVAGSTRIFGPLESSLDNSSGEVSLRRPDAPNTNGVPSLLVERVNYKDSSPWPRGADGFGLSLQRVSETGFANDPTNWVAAPTTAGTNVSGGIAPAFTLEPVSQVVTQSATVTFMAAATGDLPIEWRWRRNGEVIPGATNDTLVVLDVTGVDSGDYDVLVFNAYGSVLSSNGTLTVLIPATIVSQPQNLGLVAGSNGFISVVANSSSPLSYQWQRDGTNIPGATSDVLSFTNAQPADSGDYTVIVCDSVRCETSVVAQVLVDFPAGIVFVTQENSSTGTFRNTGISKLFDADTNNVYGSAGYIFYGTTATNELGGGTCTTTSDPINYNAVTNRTRKSLPSWLTLQNNGQNQLCGNFGYPQIDDPEAVPGPSPVRLKSGFAVRTSVPLGVDADMVNLRIGTNAPPAFRVGVVINGAGSGDSVLNVRLRQTGGIGFNNVNATRTIVSSMVTMFFDVTNAHDGDVFTLSVAKSPTQTGNANALYQALLFDELLIPVITNQPVNLAVNEGATAALTVRAGPAPVRYRWLFNGSTVVADSTNTTLTLTNVTLAHQGNYSVLVYNNAGATLSATATLTVNDITPPVIACPSNLVVQCDADVPAPNFNGSVSDNRDPNPLVVHVEDIVGGTCPKTIARTYRATDTNNNSSTCTQIITVQDTTSPVLVPPANVTVSCDANVPAPNFAGGSVSDNCDTNPTVLHIGDMSVGVNPRIITRAYRAVDVCGNSVTNTQIITVHDTIAPVISCSSNLVLEATGAVTVVTFNVGATDNCDASPTVTAVPASGTAFALGTTVVNVTAYDNGGNTNICSFTVTVRDTTPPQLECPTNRVVQCTGTNGVELTFEAIATDLVDTNVTVTFSPESGSAFTLGTNIVTCIAVDDSNNTNTCTFEVVVEDSVEPMLEITLSGANVIISWPASCTPFALKRTDDLSEPVTWQSVVEPVTHESGRFKVTVPASAAARFYRLEHP